MLCIRNILIGNQYAAEDSVYLAITGVTHLLNPAGTLAEPDCVRPHAVHLEQLGIKLLNLEVITLFVREGELKLWFKVLSLFNLKLLFQINDRPGVDISQYFPTTTTWLEEALQGGGKVLVNCWQGASRLAQILLFIFSVVITLHRCATLVLAYLQTWKKL